MGRRLAKFLTTMVFVLGCGALSGVHAQVSLPAPPPGPQMTNPARGGLRMLLDAMQLGGDQVTVGERSYPANYESPEHTHQSIELIYVLEGSFQHIVNGKMYPLGAGMLGVVKPGDRVKHKSGSSPVKVLMIWVPGGDGMEQMKSFEAPPAR